jgi:uncharacterized membrane protein YedE/YeeE
MDLLAVNTLASKVLWAAFLLSVLFGAIARRTSFCAMGAVGDIVMMGDWTRMRIWLMAMGVAIVGFQALAFTGLIDPTKTLYSSSHLIWLSAVTGGLLFGFGMVLASGCGGKTLVRIGGGNLGSVFVFAVMGLAAFATLKGITAVLRVASIDRVSLDFAGSADLPNLLAGATGLSTPVAGIGLALVIGLGLIAWAASANGFCQFDNLLAGFGIGGVIVATWWVSASLGYVDEHPDTLQQTFLATSSGKAEALSFVSPLAYTLEWLLFFSDKSRVLSIATVSVAGVVAGSAAYALLTRTFRFEGFRDTEDTANHLVGAVMMGVGGICAMGCTVGQGLSGISTLSLTSVVAVVSIIAGSVLALKFQVWRDGLKAW